MQKNGPNHLSERVPPRRYRLRIKSKKLNSGNCQVKFYASIPLKNDLYGYLLVRPQQTLREVVFTIIRKLKWVESSPDFRHCGLFSVRNSNHLINDLLLFELK